MIFVIINITASQCVKEQRQEKRERDEGWGGIHYLLCDDHGGMLVNLHFGKRMKRDFQKKKKPFSKRSRKKVI